ncbi:MAG: DNA-binding protein [Firmicutes bacterium HGW-Firmicutes-12]|nr:MAG: DNA-binding protein [Firmicutes bacterium HGW-Firmicutes-12]
MTKKKELNVPKIAYSVPEIAHMTTLSRSNIYEMIRQKKIPYVHIEGRVAIPAKEFHEWWENRIQRIRDEEGKY